jgi:hypothetical protein
VCEAVPASVARVNKRSPTATKIFSEDTPLHVASQSSRSLFKIALLRSAMIVASRVRQLFPNGERRIVRRCVSQHEDDPLRDEGAHAGLLDVVQRRVLRSFDLRSTRAPELNVTRSAL